MAVIILQCHFQEFFYPFLPKLVSHVSKADRIFLLCSSLATHGAKLLSIDANNRQ